MYVCFSPKEAPWWNGSGWGHRSHQTLLPHLWSHCAKTFTHMLILYSQTPVDQVLFRTLSSERLNNFLKVTQLINNESEFTALIPSPGFFLPCVGRANTICDSQEEPNKYLLNIFNGCICLVYYYNSVNLSAFVDLSDYTIYCISSQYLPCLLALWSIALLKALKHIPWF